MDILSCLKSSPHSGKSSFIKCCDVIKGYAQEGIQPPSMRPAHAQGLNPGVGPWGRAAEWGDLQQHAGRRRPQRHGEDEGFGKRTHESGLLNLENVRDGHRRLSHGTSAGGACFFFTMICYHSKAVNIIH